MVNTPRSLNSPVMNTPGSHDSPVINTPRSLDSPVVNTQGSRLQTRITPRIFEKIWSPVLPCLTGLGEVVWWKKPESKISWHCPFKQSNLSVPTLFFFGGQLLWPLALLNFLFKVRGNCSYYYTVIGWWIVQLFYHVNTGDFSHYRCTLKVENQPLSTIPL